MAYTRLILYNNALRIVGERRLASLTEARKPRYLLDQVWDEGGVDFCLEQGQWNFALRAVRIDKDPAVDPGFGLTYGFTKPSDWIRTAGFCSDEFFRAPILQYVDEADFWYADVDPVYVRYVSNHADWGTNLALWPKTFSRFVAAHFASEIVFDVTADKERIELAEKLAVRRKRDALAKDAMNEPTRIPPPSSWPRARTGYGAGRRDGGSRSNLIG